MKTKVIMLVASLVAMPAYSQTMYKCPSPTPGLPATYQQMPCPQGGGETLEKKELQSTGTSMMSDSAMNYLADVEKQNAEQARADAEEDKRREALNVERGKVKAAEEQAAAQRATARAILMTGRRW